jgi:hypothetical protein
MEHEAHKIDWASESSRAKVVNDALEVEGLLDEQPSRAWADQFETLAMTWKNEGKGRKHGNTVTLSGATIRVTHVAPGAGPEIAEYLEGLVSNTNDLYEAALQRQAAAATSRQQSLEGLANDALEMTAFLRDRASQ